MYGRHHKSENQKIELRPAYTWTCENCGRDNYQTLYMYPDHFVTNLCEQIKETGETKDLVIELWPMSVICGHCQSNFEVGSVY